MAKPLDVAIHSVARQRTGTGYRFGEAEDGRRNSALRNPTSSAACNPQHPQTPHIAVTSIFADRAQGNEATDKGRPANRLRSSLVHHGIYCRPPVLCTCQFRRRRRYSPPLTP